MVTHDSYRGRYRVLVAGGTACPDKGVKARTWPNCMNMFDGFTHWSAIKGSQQGDSRW